VNIGSVSEIDIAPDLRQVKVSYDLGVTVLASLGLAKGDGQETTIAIPVGLRAQIGSAGLTGVKYVQIDFFDPKTNPPPKLTFPVPPNYIPAAQSTMKNLEDSVVRAVDQFPALAADMLVILKRVNAILIDVEDQHLSEKATATLANVDQTLANLDATLGVARSKLLGLDSEGLSTEAKLALANVSTTMTRAQGLMQRIDGEQGVLDSVQRATDSIGDVAGDARGYGTELSTTLRDLSEASNAVRQLLEVLELDSDMLLKGRAKVRQ
jgi:paraquat-inducible protein B